MAELFGWQERDMAELRLQKYVDAWYYLREKNSPPT